MTRTVDIPVQMISCCSMSGDFTPMRFRFRKPDDSIMTVNIDEIIMHKEPDMPGIGEMEYLCKAVIDNRVTLFSLRYNVRIHCWRLARIVE